MNSEDLKVGWRISAKVIAEQACWAAEGGRLFATSDWARVLAALPAEPLFAWHSRQGIGTVVPVFRRFGRRIGFLGLPAAGEDFDSMDGHTLTMCMAGITSAANLDFIRTTQYMRARFDPQATGVRPEVWIDDLKNWDMSDRKRLRKDLAFARRAAHEVELVEHDFDANACHGMYVATVARNHGKERYGPNYFAALKSLATNSPCLRFFVARDGSRIRGFAVVAIHGTIANYLHGAADAEGRRQGVGDLLLERLVACGREAGATRFTFMPSPWTQPGLTQYKKKWGDSLGLAVTFDHGYGLFGRCAKVVSRWQCRHDRRAVAAYVADSDLSLGRQ